MSKRDGIVYFKSQKYTLANFSSPTGHALATDPLNKTCARASLTHTKDVIITRQEGALNN